jgi:hypothetical protein
LVGVHKVYVPLKASQPDLETSLHMNELVKLARGMNPTLRASAIISMAPTNPVINEAREAMELLSELHELVLSQAIVRERKVYRDASKFTFPTSRKERDEEPDVQVDPGKLQAFAAGARDRPGQRPWEEHDPKAPPRHNVSVRLNDYYLAMLQYVAEAMDTSQQKVLRKQLIPRIGIMAEEAYAKSPSQRNST